MKQDVRFRKLLPFAVLLACLVLTAYVWQLSSKWIKVNAEERFTKRVDEITADVVERIYDYRTILRSSAALLAARVEVNREQWRIFVEDLRIGERYPGIQGFGFAKIIRHSELQAHIAKVRAEGFPGYTVYPEGERQEYIPVIYLEPFDKRNRRAFGYGMFSEPVRRAALEHARDTGLASITGNVKLVVETDANIQQGVSYVYRCFYKKGMPLTTVQERRAALLGFVYNSFRMNDLMQGIFKGDLRDVELAI